MRKEVRIQDFKTKKLVFLDHRQEPTDPSKFAKVPESPRDARE